MNIPAITSLFRLLRDPALCLPHHTIPTFADLPIPLSPALALSTANPNPKPPTIKAIVLDKDNTFALPNTTTIHPSSTAAFKALQLAYPAASLLIVSNSAGLMSSDPTGTDAAALERATGVPVLRHARRKPACGDEILAHFGGAVASPAEIAVVGDRLLTDVIMANRMGAYAVWVREGVVRDRGVVTRVEYGLAAWLWRRGYVAPRPGNGGG